MQHAEPKVTIDLKEYNELLEKSKAVDGNEALINAKQVILTLMKTTMNQSMVLGELRRKGLHVSLNTSTIDPQPSDLIIVQVPKQ